MSDSEHSTVTYTSISNDYEEPSDVGSPGVVVYGYDGVPMHPPSPDYVPDPEHPPSPVYVQYVLEPAYLEFMPHEDDVFPAEEQPLPATISPDDVSDEEEDEGEDEEEEEHLALVDSVLPPAYRTTARMSIRAQTHIPFPSEAKVDRLIAIPTPPPSPLTPLSSLLPRIPSPPFPVPSPLTTSPTDAGAPLGYRAIGIRLRTTSSPLTTSPTDAGAPLALLMLEHLWATARNTGGFRADYGFVSTLDAEIRRDPDREIGYEITDVWEDPDEIAEEIPTTDVAELGQRMTDFITTVRHDTDEIYRRLDDAHDDRSLMSGHLNLLRTDRRSHTRMARLMESEARASREAWVQSMDASDTIRSEVKELRTTVLA
ncbi:hypothetical protein Tco_1311319 [Tanacetum coccineum]